MDIACEVCVVGGGPAGMMLGLLLARKGIDVVVLEKHGDFLRDFRGDTVARSRVLCIGDAAHAMSPVGGVGINLAVQDAVAAARILIRRLASGPVDSRTLAAIQRRRWLPSVGTQLAQRAAHRFLVAPALGATAPVPAPVGLRMLAHLPVVQGLISWWVSDFGLNTRREVETPRRPRRLGVHIPTAAFSFRNPAVSTVDAASHAGSGTKVGPSHRHQVFSRYSSAAADRKVNP